MTLRNLLVAACLLLPLMASAHNIEKGQRVPRVVALENFILVSPANHTLLRCHNRPDCPERKF